MPDARTCPECGAAIPDGQPRGLCPRCALSGLLNPADDGSGALAPHGQGKGTPVAGRCFGDYELLEEIARGGMGVVYKARQKSLDRLVAVKFLLFGPHASTEFIKRFRIEASAAAALQHPSIVAIHEVGVHEGEHFLVMDLVDGPNLAKLVREQPLPPKRAAQYLKTIAEAIHYAHEHGILHRDLKPSNVLIDSTDQPRVTDFGLAKRLETDSQPSTQLSQLTVSGQVMGSPGYMPPEQASGGRGKMSRRSDVYSLGAMLYHLLTGRPPFGAGSVAETLKQVESQEPVSLQLLNPAVPLDLETICTKCLQKEPRIRYHTALELAEECGRFMNDEPICARPITRAEKLWRWCRRHPAVASLAAAVAVLLITATTVSTVAALRVSSARNAAFDQWHRAAISAVEEARQRQRTEQTLRDVEMWRAEDFFSSNDSRTALAWLARVLRRKPGERAAAERVLAALTQRSFALPLFECRLQGDGFLMAAVSPNGRFVATVELTNPAVAGVVTVWDSRTREPVGTPSRSATVLFLQFSPDGDRWLCLSNTHVFIQKTLATDAEVVALAGY